MNINVKNIPAPITPCDSALENRIDRTMTFKMSRSSYTLTSREFFLFKS